jgi:predicted O-methyltransferase YrrM
VHIEDGADMSTLSVAPPRAAFTSTTRRAPPRPLEQAARPVVSDYTQIEGWFGPFDVQFYAHQVRRVRGPARFVEIGSWKGRSSFFMASEIQRSGKPIELYCVDTWGGSDEHIDSEAVRSGTLYDEFLSNIATVREHLRPLRATSLEAAELFEDASLDFVFIDAAHDFENVRADIQAWRPKVKPGGVLAGHDYLACWPGVILAVEQAFAGRARVFDSCWYVADGQPGAPWSFRELRKRLCRQLRQYCRGTYPRLGELSPLSGGAY